MGADMARGGTIQQTMGPAEWAMLIALSVLWGASFFFVGVTVAELPTLTIVAARVAGAAAALWLAAGALGVSVPRRPEVWGAFLVMGLLNNAAPFTLIVWGQQTVPSGLASILNGATPLFTVLVAGVMLADERFSGRRLLGVLIGLAGVAVMIGLDAVSGLGASLVGQAAILCAALSYAFASVWGRRFRALGVAPMATAAGQATASSAVLAPIALWVDAPLSGPAPSAAALAALAALAVLSTALAYWLYFQILARSGATNVALVTLLVPVSAIALGAVFLGERLGWPQALGMATIALGLSVIDGRLWRRGG